MRVKVNSELCSGTGLCEQTCPDVFELKEGISTVKVNEVIKSSSCYNVIYVFWSEDGKSFNYALDTCNELDWFSYDLKSHTISTLESPLHYDNLIWQRLKAIPPSFEQVIYGHVSPSGKHVIYNIKNSDNTEWWLTDNIGKYKLKLDEAPANVYHVIGEVVWLEHETRIIYGVNLEAGVILYDADINTGRIEILFDGIYDWSVSPDGLLFLVVNNDNKIIISSSKGENSINTEESGLYLKWSKDGKVIYYLSPSSTDDEWEIRAYETTTRQIRVLLKSTELKKLFGYTPGYAYFTVSPDEAKIVFWVGSLYLIELIK